MFEPLGRIVIDSRLVRPRDVFWGLRTNTYDGTCYADEAFSRGALGVVTGRRIEPWAGKFTIRVDDPASSLRRFLRCLRGPEGAWPAGLLAGDETTQNAISAVWGGDALLLENLVEALGKRAASVA